jgi:hypothetical protein
MIQKFARDESGMTLGLAMIMILLIGVMGAGLLTFADTNLQTVVEVNRGQRAFEVADAGVEVAKRQLASHCAADPTTCSEYYDDTEDGQIGAPDNQWSVINGGVTLNDLDMDEDAFGRADSVHIVIDRRNLQNDYVITSTGTYGEAGEEAKRKIEAIIKGITADNVGEGLGHPIYYTPSAVTIEVDETDPARVEGFTLDDISMFSEQDILIEGIATPDEFVNEYGQGDDKSIKISGGNAEELGNWNSMDPRYFNDPKPYNTTPRLTTTVHTVGNNPPRDIVSTDDFDTPGFGAEGKICELTATDPTPGLCDSTFQSIADGVSSYDSTTGTHAPDGTPNTNTASPPRPVSPAQAQKCTFMSKPFPANGQCYITYPFPRPEPPPAKIKFAAEEADTETDRHYWSVATEGTPDWGALLPGCTDPDGCMDRLVFVDAGAAAEPLEYVNDGRAQGVMVVWCGDLQLNSDFKGVIFNLYGDGSAFGASNCAEDSPDLTIDRGPATNGVFTNNGEFCQCWLYAQGGDDARAGIQIKPGSTVKFLPGVEWSFKEFLDDILDDDPPLSFEVRSWRELYE